MKNLIDIKKYLLIVLLICTLPVFAQQNNLQPGAGGGRIEALKIAYITKKLNLSPEEAQKFWPIYNKYAAELRQARVEKRKQEVSEIEAEEKILNIRKKYNSQFSRALSPEKVNTFFRSEKEFSGYVQKELSERRQLRQQLNDNKRSR